ncbi:hypothetical protein AcetOrient_orf02869 [Acetobacter orientalis]|uniref:Uncharacterized protein n=1 Tax=Acetobacter orientalis TaxID=146474 RepID=A0A2Z5ZIP6_9PROT|nr:hypothetical protein AcetOrient_orf02869 [Acetobacter orientalis]
MTSLNTKYNVFVFKERPLVLYVLVFYIKSELCYKKVYKNEII